jgi:hypothetical protein
MNADTFQTVEVPLNKLLLCGASHNNNNAELLFMRSRGTERTIGSYFGDTLAERYGLENCA